MRNAAVILFSLFIAAAAFGQQPKNEFSVFVTDASVSFSSDRGTQGSAGFGVAFNRMVTPRVSAQFAVGSERHHTYSYFVDPADGSFHQINPLPFRTYPIDVAVRYHFLNETRWRPYIGIGARYVRQPHIAPQFNYQNHFGPEIVGGTSFQFTRSFGLALDGRIYVGDREQYDEPFKTSFGVLWRF